jgi:hypothetical protein
LSQAIILRNETLKKKEFLEFEGSLFTKSLNCYATKG